MFLCLPFNDNVVTKCFKFTAHAYFSQSLTSEPLFQISGPAPVYGTCQFAPLLVFSETFCPQLILGKDVLPPWSELRKTFRTLTIFQKDVWPTNHNLERRFVVRTHFIIRKDVSPPLIFMKDVSHPNQKDFSPHI